MLSAVDTLVTDKAAVLDIDSIELFEWSLQEMGLPYDYSKTIGVLRARWAKANPSSPAVLECLEACILAWDLVNAQQVWRFRQFVEWGSETVSLMHSYVDCCHTGQGTVVKARWQEHVLECHAHAPSFCKLSSVLAVGLVKSC